MRVSLCQPKLGLLIAFLLTFAVAKAEGGLDSLFLSNARSVIFKVNSTKLPPSDTAWLADSLIPVLQAYGPQGIVLGRSAASPEGPLSFNRRMSSGRRKAVVRFLKQKGFDASRIHFDEVAEEYDLLVEMMRQHKDPDYLRVRDIVIAGNDRLERIKSNLQQADSGQLWSRLHKEYFPNLRAVRIMAWDRVTKIPILLGNLPVETSQLLSEQYPSVPSSAESSDLPSEPRTKLLAVRTNLLYDAWYQPQYGWAPGINIQLEYYPREGHITYNAGFTFHNHKRWSDYKFFQTRDADIEARWYFKPQYVGPYAGIDLHASWYGIGFSKSKGWEGEGGGGGLVLGWSHYLTRNQRWRLDLNVGVGYFYTRYDPFQYGNSLTGEEDGYYYYNFKGDVESFHRRNHRFQWVGPTQAGVHLTYVLLYRRNHSRGASFRRTEKGDGL